VRTYASVCDGIGAVHVAWTPLDWRCLWLSEIDPFANAVVEARWPSLINLGDANRITRKEIDERGRPDVLVGGTPCQSFSFAGRRAGMDDPRGGLALRFVELVGACRPRWVVWENVPGVLSSREGRDLGAVLGGLAELGYGFAWRVLDARHFGVPQRRRRLFVVASAGDWRRAAAVLLERRCLSGNPASGGGSRAGASGVARTSAQGTGRPELKPSVVDRAAFNQGRGAQFRCTIGEVDAMPSLIARGPHAVATWWDGGQTAQTIDAVVAKGQTMPERGRFPAVIDPSARPSRIRRLTPRECERLQGFPDDYTRVMWRSRSEERCPDGHRYRVIGNSMAVPVMRWIAERIDLVESLS
jgi:DNA (cytosine-5)-methyltransferase 1